MMFSTIRLFRRSRKGNFAAITALLSVPLLACVAVTVEYSNLSDHQARLQHAVDAAALFVGKRELENGVVPSDDDVYSFVLENFDGDVGSVTVKGVETAFADYTVMATSTAPHYFFGRIKPEIFAQSAQAMVGKNNIDDMAVALVLDTTASMGTTNMNALKDAATSLIDTISARATNYSDIRVGIVPFANHVNVGLSNQHASWIQVEFDDWEGCVGSREAPYTFKDTAPNARFTGVKPIYGCPNAITPLSADWSDLKENIQSLEAWGPTYFPPGLLWGLRVLSPASPFDEAAEMDNPIRVIVFMTDGWNATTHQLDENKFTNDRWLSYRDASGAWVRSDVSDVATSDVCDEIKFRGVLLYTIAFGKRASSISSDLLLDCASSSSTYFEADNRGELQEVFEKIADELNRLRLTG